jgi:hypothetical protein
MSRLEDELQKALCREEPPPQFADQVMARIAASRAGSGQGEQGRKQGWLRRLAEFFRPLPMKWALAGAALCLVAFSVYGVKVHRQRQQALAEIARGEKAKEQVILAMRIAGTKLNLAQRKVQESIER